MTFSRSAMHDTHTHKRYAKLRSNGEYEIENVNKAGWTIDRVCVDRDDLDTDVADECDKQRASGAWPFAVEIK